MLELTLGEEIVSYLSFGKADTDTVTVMVPMATTVSVLDADKLSAKMHLSTAQTRHRQVPARPRAC